MNSVNFHLSNIDHGAQGGSVIKTTRFVRTTAAQPIARSEMSTMAVNLNGRRIRMPWEVTRVDSRGGTTPYVQHRTALNWLFNELQNDRNFQKYVDNNKFDLNSLGFSANGNLTIAPKKSPVEQGGVESRVTLSDANQPWATKVLRMRTRMARFGVDTTQGKNDVPLQQVLEFYRVEPANPQTVEGVNRAIEFINSKISSLEGLVANKSLFNPMGQEAVWLGNPPSATNLNLDGFRALKSEYDTIKNELSNIASNFIAIDSSPLASQPVPISTHPIATQKMLITDESSGEAADKEAGPHVPQVNSGDIGKDVANKIPIYNDKSSDKVDGMGDLPPAPSGSSSNVETERNAKIEGEESTITLPQSGGAHISKTGSDSSATNIDIPTEPWLAKTAAGILIVGGAGTIFGASVAGEKYLTAKQKATLTAIGSAAAVAGGTLTAIIAPGATTILGTIGEGGVFYKNLVSMANEYGFADKLTKNAAYIEIGGNLLLFSIGAYETQGALEEFFSDPSLKNALTAFGTGMATAGVGMGAFPGVNDVMKNAKFGWVNSLSSNAQKAENIGVAGDGMAFGGAAAVFGGENIRDNNNQQAPVDVHKVDQNRQRKDKLPFWQQFLATYAGGRSGSGHEPTRG